MKVFSENHKWLCFVLLGLASALPFTIEYLFFLSWFLYAFFFVVLLKLHEKSASLKREFLYIFLFFFSFHFGIYHFFMALVPMTMIGLSAVPSFFLMLFTWLFLSFFHALPLSLMTLLFLRLRLSSSAKIFAMALSVVLVQYLQSLGTYGFSWARVSLPQSALLPLIQASTLLGPYFIDLILMAVNALIAVGIYKKSYSFYCLIALAVFFADFLFGFVYMNCDLSTTSEKRVSIVQGNVQSGEKWSGSSSYSTYMRETLSLDESDTLVVWGETAIPTTLNNSKKILSELEAYTLSSGNEMLVGAFYQSNVGRELNGAYYISKGETSDNVYFKRRLVPFGEFLPMRSVLEAIPILDGINLYSSDLYPGNMASIMDTEKGAVGCLICFDSIFSQLARASVREGAELLVIMTNDSWYKDYPAVYQHNNQAVWRAVENKRWVVRSANSGVSSFITPNGEIISSLPPLVKGTLSETVGFISQRSPYTVVGDVVIIPVFIILLFCFIKGKAPDKSSRA